MSLPVSRSKILGLGVSVPEGILSNADLERMVETDDEWIYSRTGIRERRRLRPDESINDHGTMAARRALADAKMDASQLDALICCTYTGDTVCPSTSCAVHRSLGLQDVPAMDINAACSGFMYGLQVADSFIRTGLYKNVLVVGLDGQTRYVDYTDRGTCIIFGDGAGAAVVGPAPEGSESGILATYLGADSHGTDLITLGIFNDARETEFGVPIVHDMNKPRAIRMAGREVFKFAVRTVGHALDKGLELAGISADQVDLLVPHQANIRIIDAAAERLGMPRDRVIVNIEKYGNTAAASIPLALEDARLEGKLQPGTTVALVGFGAGFTYGCVILKW